MGAARSRNALAHPLAGLGGGPPCCAAAGGAGAGRAGSWPPRPRSLPRGVAEPDRLNCLLNRTKDRQVTVILTQIAPWKSRWSPHSFCAQVQRMVTARIAASACSVCSSQPQVWLSKLLVATSSRLYNRALSVAPTTVHQGPLLPQPLSADSLRQLRVATPRDAVTRSGSTARGTAHRAAPAS